MDGCPAGGTRMSAMRARVIAPVDRWGAFWPTRPLKAVLPPRGTPVVALEPIAVHALTGHINPRCTVCGRTAIAIGAQPRARCERFGQLPFDFRETP